MKITKLLRSTGLLFLFFLFSLSAYAQSTSVKGTVKSVSGESLIGVNVIEVGTTNGTITDVKGNYTLKVSPKSKLKISYLGYKAAIVEIGAKSILNIVLEEDNKALDEVVVVGYGTAKKSDLTGAIASANIKDFEKMPNTNIVQSLQGAVPGLNIGQVTSAGSTPSIEIRGKNTINGSTNVLVVIDGIVSGNLQSINPADVESVNVLKDASSTAIYGAAASNGVMLITTKKGKAGKAKVSLSSSYTTQSATNDYSLMNRAQYLSFLKNLMWDQAYTAASGYTADNPSFVLANYLPVTTMKSTANADGITTTDFNWWKAGTQTPTILENKVSINGGTDDISYYVSYSNTNQQNLLINDNFKRNTVRANLDAKVRSWWKLGMQLSGSFVNQDGQEPALYSLYVMNPLVTPYNTDGSIKPYPMENANGNPFMGNNVDDQERHNYFVGNVYSEFQLPIKGLTYRVNYGNNYVINTHYQTNPYGNSQTGECYKEFSNSYSYTLDNIVNFNRDFGLHNIGVTLVYGAAQYNYSYTKADATSFSFLTLGYNSLKVGTNQYTYSNANSSSSLYQVGRINYKYNNKYLFTATIRRDGNSAFAANNKTAIFPSAALGWVASEESFFKSLLPVVNFLKVRGGYGMTGNTLDSYKSLAIVQPNPGYVFGDGTTGVLKNELTTLENPNLKWEKTGGFNAGIDFHLFNDRIIGSVDAYKTKTTDLIWNLAIPTITGFSYITSNVGSLSNQGAELSITSRNIVKKDFEWSTTFNISTNSNKILSLTGSGDLITSGLFIGQSVNAVYGYKIDGIYQVSDTKPSGYYTGDYKIHDENGDGQITTADRTILGKKDAAYRLSMMNKFTYKGFSLSFFLNSVQGGKDGYLGENTYTIYQDNTGRGNSHLNEFVKNIWSPLNPNGIYSAYATGGNITPIRYEDRSFIRLQDVTLNYILPKNIISVIGLQNVNIYVSGKNLLTFTKWHGWDPEANNGTITPIGRSSSIDKTGDDYEGRPVMKSFTVGLDVSF